MLTRPTLNGLMVCEATEDIKFDFFVDKSSDQVFGHTIEVYENMTNALVHTHNAMSFLLNCTIKAMTLQNGKEYKVRIRTYNNGINNDFSNISGTNSSAWSDYMILRCFTKAKVSIYNIPTDLTGNNVIKNQTFTFEGTYQQQENVGLKSYRYILYDKDKVQLQIYPAIYQMDGVLKQEATGFKSNEEYYIELVTLNQYDIETRSELIGFRVDYQPPRVTNIFEVKNDKENALVKIDAQIIQMLLRGENYVFEDYVRIKRARELSEYLSSFIGDISKKTLNEISYEIIHRKQGEYHAGGSPYNIISIPQYFIEDTTIKNKEEVFFINLTEENARVWIDSDNGLNMDDEFTMQVWAESITPNKPFLKIVGKNSNITFIIEDKKVHCYEKNGEIIRHCESVIGEGYNETKPLHLFIQRRNGYMRIVTRMVI